jgi:tetratricopeptide (TPR) repeat protein
VLLLFKKKYSHISRNLKHGRKLFLSGDSKGAQQFIVSLRNKKTPLLKKPEDVAMLRDIYISVGHARTAQAIIRVAVKTFPENVFVQLSGLILKSQRRNSMRILQEAKALEILCKTPEDIALWHAVNARLSASLGMMETSAEWLKKTKSLLDKSYLEAWYHYSLTHIIRRDWVEAVKVTQTLIDIDSSLENKILLIRALLSKGDLTQAKVYIQSIDADKGKFYLADSLSIQFYYFIGEIDAAINRLECLRDHWPEIPSSSIESTMVQLYWLQGDVESAKTMAEKINDPFLEILNTASPTAKRKLITLPVMTQEPMMCLPTTVAMTASAYKIDLSAAELFRDMRGNDGTEIWRMQQHMESIGFDVVYIHPNYEIVKKCLDRGHPLIGSKVTLFNAHVEVIAGYDEGLDGLFIRDPESLTPYFVAKDYLHTAYTAAGNYLIALAPKKVFDWLPDSAINHDVSNLIQLKKSIALGNLDKARLCFDSISDKSVSTYYRDLYALGAFLSPAQYIESMKLHSVKDDLDDILKLNAIISTQDSDLIQDWITDFKKRHDTLSKEFTQYLEMLVLRSRRDYTSVLERLDFLIAKSPSTDALWSYKAESELELGEMEAAKKSIQIALDLSPASYDIKRKIRQISPYQESYSDKLSLLCDQIEHYPGVFELEEELADLLLEGDNGLDYEKAIKGCIAKRPLYPWNYNKLANWYLQQDREDLAQNILDQGRNVLTEEELPQLYFEIKQNYSSESQSNNRKINDTVEVSNDVPDNENLSRIFRDIIHNWFNSQLPSEKEKIFLKKLNFSDLKWLEESSLSWWEQAYIIGISFAVKDRETEKRKKIHTLSNFLPLSLPHKVTQMLIAFNKAVEAYPLSSAASQCLYEWEMAQLNGEKEWRYDIAFDLAYLQEIAGFLNQAEARYNEIIKNMPGYYPAYYRLAFVYNQKGMKNEAVQQYKSCISIAPNHFGALSSLIDTLTNLNDIQQAKDWCRYRYNVSPYSFTSFEQWIYYVAHVDGVEQAWQKLKDYRSYLTSSEEIALRARLLEKKGHYQAAEGLLKQIINSVKYERHIHVTRTRCAIGQENWSSVLRLTDDALVNDPYDLWFVEVKVTALENKGANDIHEFIAEQFVSNVFSENLASAWLRAVLRSTDDPSYVRENVSNILNTIPEASIRFYLLQYLTGYFAHYSYDNEYLLWLKMCDNEFPNDLFFIERMVEYYRAIGKINQAIEIAETYYDNNPDDTDAVLLYGRILEDENPEIAIKYLQKAYKKSGSVECLSRIGRTYHNLGKHKEARKAYWEVLEKNPYDDLSINNLIILSEDPKTIYPYVADAINHGIGNNTEYFLVSAVKTALQINTTVPHMWLDLAENRFKQLQSVNGYRDEMPCIAKALYEWYMYLGDKEKAEGILQQADIKKPIIGSFKWPGKKWIPNAQV